MTTREKDLIRNEISKRMKRISQDMHILTELMSKLSTGHLDAGLEQLLEGLKREEKERGGKPNLREVCQMLTDKIHTQ